MNMTFKNVLKAIWPFVLLASSPCDAAGTLCRTRASLSDHMRNARYMQRPELILEDYPTGGIVMEKMIAAQTATRAGFAQLVIGLVLRANERQKEAIGRGLWQFAEVCNQSDPSVKRAIIERVHNSGDRALLRAFSPDLTVSSDASTTLALSPSVRSKAKSPKLPGSYFLDGSLDRPLMEAPTSPFAQP